MKRIAQLLQDVLRIALRPVARYVERNLVCYAYSGSTAVSSLANPPRQIAHGGSPIVNQSGNLLGISGTSIASTLPFVGGTSLWYYCSSDSATIASSPAYFTDGLALGMRSGDVMLVVNQSSYGTSPSFSIGVIGTSNSTAGFNLVIGGVIQSS